MAEQVADYQLTLCCDLCLVIRLTTMSTSNKQSECAKERVAGHKNPRARRRNPIIDIKYGTTYRKLGLSS
jgi:hypothetical protein